MSPRHLRTAPAAALVCLALIAASCSGKPTDAADGSAPATAKPTTTIPAPIVSASVENGASGVPLTTPIGVSVKHGTLATVAITPGSDAFPAPRPGPGVFNTDRSGWLSPSDFAPSTPYEVTASVTDVAGRKTRHEWNFTTGAAKTELHTTLNVGDGGTYGVGMPVIVTLNSPVAQANRKAVTDQLKVTSDPPVTGGWRWFSDTEIHYRPSVYWPAHAKVTLGVNFAGLHLGPGVWGVDGRKVNFTIGDAHISTVDATAHTMSVQVNGKVVNHFPVSTGNAKYPTHSGIHVVNEKSPKVTMDSATVGIPRDSPDGYYETVLWDVRISNSGEFVHAAPWSTGAQGSSNVSHGCVNASTANAEWFYNFSIPGDVVQVLNTPLNLQPWNGYGDWQIPWDQWVN